MQVESVSFVYSEAEMTALMHLLGYGGVPLRPGRSEWIPQGMEELEKARLLHCGETQTGVDKIAAFLAKSIAAARYAVCIWGERTYFGLFYAPLATLWLRYDRARWVVTPFQTPQQALLQALEQMPEPAQGLSVTVRTPDNEHTYTYAVAPHRVMAERLFRQSFSEMPPAPRPHMD